jgi:hypothetical protein
MPVFCLFTLGRHVGTARFVVYCTCAKYRVVEYYRVCRIRDVILKCLLVTNVRSVVLGTPDYSTSNTNTYDINEICLIEVLITQKCHYLQH